MSRTIWLAVAAAALAACAGQREGGQAAGAAGASGGAQPAAGAGAARGGSAEAGGGAGPADGARERQATADAAARREACIDTWLAQRGLNAYGDPPGTMYMGGTPLFDEATGERRDRVAYLDAKLPELAKACP